MGYSPEPPSLYSAATSALISRNVCVADTFSAVGASLEVPELVLAFVPGAFELVMPKLVLLPFVVIVFVLLLSNAR